MTTNKIHTISKGRDTRIDTIKGFLIILVIMGHLVEKNIVSFGCNFTHNFIYLFHMPLFVLLSGYVCNVNSKRFFIGTFGIIEAYIIYMYFIRMALPVSTYHLWYLLALFVWRLIDYATRNVNTLFIVSLAFLSAILCGFVESIGYGFSLSRIIVFSSFYFLGRLCRERNILQKIYNMPKVIGVSIIVSTLIFLYFVTNIGRVVYCSQPYTILSSNVFIGCGIRVTFLLFSAIICSAIISLSKTNSILTSIGQNTLPIYIYHATVIACVAKFSFIPLNLISFSIITITYLFVMQWLSKHINFDWFLHPIMHFISKKSKPID